MTQAKKKTVLRKALLRAFIQLLFFLSMPGAFVAGFNGVKYIFRWIGTGEMLQLNSFVKTLIGLSLFTILFGRYFCGFVCSFGSLGDFVYWLSGLFQKKILRHKKQYRFPMQILPWLQLIKYLNLMFMVAITALGLAGILRGTSPWDVFSHFTALNLSIEGYEIGAVALAIVIVLMCFHPRAFCQFLCPMGAVFALLPMAPFGTLVRHSSNCIPNCKLCAMQCPAGIKLETDGRRNGECIGCEKCTAVCPRGNISHVGIKLYRYEAIGFLAKAIIYFVLGVYLGLCRFL